MWLINTSTFSLEDRRRVGDKPYAILSHRWQDEEVSYQDMNQPLDKRLVLHGWAKLSTFLVLARNKGYKYAWADTCCINKDSMTELSEAISSMYQWYENSDVCIAFLHDVDVHGGNFTDAEWFQRGWTLQELIAPRRIEFYDRAWNCMGGKHELLAELARRTAVPKPVLLGTKKVKEYSVAQRMAWAADRETERIEDRAWSLLGLFDIRNMQPSYGGGEAAFQALQEEIIKRHPDHSIFAWTMLAGMRYSGPFAPSPSAFKECANVQCQPCSEPFSVDNQGLSIELRLRPFSMNTYLCILSASQDGKWRAILLAKTPGGQRYVRAQDSKQQSVFSPTDMQGFTQRHLRIATSVPDMSPPIYYGFWLRNLAPPGVSSSTVKFMSRDGRDNQDRITLPEGHYGTAGVVCITPMHNRPVTRWSRLCWLKLGFSEDFKPTCLLANHTYESALDAVHFDKALNPEADPQLRARFLSRAWIYQSTGSLPHTTTAWRDGHCRIISQGTGGAVKFEALNLKISVRLITDPEPVASIQTSEQLLHQNRKIWTVDIDDIGGSSPEARHCCSEVEYCMSWTVGAMFAIFMFPCVLKEVYNQRMEDMATSQTVHST